MNNRNKIESEQNKSIVDILLKERLELVNELTKLKVQVEILDEMITKYSGNSRVAYEDNSLRVTVTNRDNLILDLFNSIGRCIRLPDFERAYQLEYNDNRIITNTCRRLRSEGLLVVVKYNNNNKLSFWGIPTWLDGNNFKDGYGPNRNELPAGTIDTQVI